jgi:hypothetical protein
MNQYECKKCNKVFKEKHHLHNHLNKKYPCDRHFTNSAPKCPKNLVKITNLAPKSPEKKDNNKTII